MRFRDKNSVSDQRRRRLALDLGLQQDLVDIGKLTELTPRLAKAYAYLIPMFDEVVEP